MEMLDLKGVSDPELIIGLVGPLGSPIEKVVRLLEGILEGVGYSATVIRLSHFLKAYSSLPTKDPPASAASFERWNALMSRGNELRQKLGRGDALAIHAIADIANRRPPDPPRSLVGKAFILRQLKHPDEVSLLRQVYRDAFHLIGVFTAESIRNEYLRNVKNIKDDDARTLILRDAGEEIQFGQQVTKTYHLSDHFIEVGGWRDRDLDRASDELKRYVNLLFGQGVVTPTMEEQGMFLAHAAALRSADLSRQVGAAILTCSAEVLAVGTNEVPKAGGGQYWEQAGDRDESAASSGDGRDFVKGFDSNDVIKRDAIREALALLTPGWKSLQESEKEARVGEATRQLSDTRLMNLTEFGRAVHAEMEAILSATRVGVSIRGSILYTTTFPCHNCAKHIVAAGISEVVFIEPYPKSLASRLHGDAIAFAVRSEADEEDDIEKVPFRSFVGVAPRRYQDLFSLVRRDGSRVKRKDDTGMLVRDRSGLRLHESPLSHIDREAMVASYLLNIVESLKQLKLELN